GTYAAASLPAPTAPISPAPVLSQELRALDLRLPPLPARIRALAHRLVADVSDPFSRAWAIQAYLRGPGGRYGYDTAPPPTPAGPVLPPGTSSVAAPSPRGGTPMATPSARASATPAPSSQPSATPAASRTPASLPPGGGPHVSWPHLGLPVPPSAVLAALMAV